MGLPDSIRIARAIKKIKGLKIRMATEATVMSNALLKISFGSHVLFNEDV